MSSEVPAPSSSSSFADRLAAVRTLRQSARKDNRDAAMEEGARLQEGNGPNSAEALERRAQWDAAKAVPKREALLTVSAGEAEKVARRAARKDPDKGFSTYEQATVRQYNRLIKQIKPVDQEEYDRQKRKYGEAFYGGPNALLHGLHTDKKEAVDKMVTDLEQQIIKRQKYSRRRTHNDDADVDYINERNAKFNKKLERFYGEHTAEIKQNLERGTAI